MIYAAPNLSTLVRLHNRRVGGEALLTFGVGVVSCIVTFGVIYWLSWLTFTMCLRGMAYRGPWVMSGIITGVFFLVSVISAWRQVDPIAAAGVGFKYSTGEVMKDMVGIGLGIPIIRREGVAGAAALLIGGPANLLEVWPIWCGRLPADATLIADAERLLIASEKGVDPKTVRDPRTIALLHRLGLIKSVHQADATLLVQSTQKGLDVLAAKK